MPDTSEQEFSASLEAAIEPPAFVLDEPELHALEISKRIPGAPIPSPGELEMTAADPSLTQDSPEFSDSPGKDQAGVASKAPDWREQISAKVNSYKSRSRHKPRYPSLQLQFEERPYRARQNNEELTDKEPATFSQSVAAEIMAMQSVPIARPDPPRITLEATARVLEFPRPAAPVYDPDELAEPMLDRPRIVEAPELLPPPPAMGGILIETPAQPEPERRPGFDVPLQSAPMSRRLWAGAVDALLLAIAVATFTYVFVRITNVVPPWKIVAESCAGLFAMLWPAYEYAFLVFSKETPGLRLAKLEIRRFDGAPAPRSLRRWRVLASYLSAASLGLGYAWCFLDEDQLSWHDRITRTHLALLQTVHPAVPSSS